jgi:ribonucleotide reductase alpha subunit
MNSLEELKLAGEAPEWMNEDGYKTLSNGYLLPNETPKQMYIRVAEAAASYYKDSEMWSKKFFDAMWKNWLCLASPVASNLGTDRGMPISCNALHSGDSLHSIFMKNHELAILSKNGAGVGIYLGDIRGRGATIKGNGKSEGIVPWAKVFDATTLSVSQGSTRRGASAIYLPIEHLDIKEFINIRRPTGDINRRCLNIHHGICISDSWMKSMLEGDESKRELWIEILKARFETGEPYLFFSDNVNNKNPECYVKNNLQVKTSNICCLSGDTLVLTKDGNKKIEELVGKTVEIYDGLNWIKNSSFELKGEDELYRIYIKDGSFVDCNKNHRWFVANDYNDIRNKKYKETLTENLKVGDFIENHDEEIHGDLEEPAAYLKGFLLGDGTYIKDRPMLNLHSTKYCCLDKLVESGNELEANNFNTNSIKNISFSEEKDNTGLYDNVYGMQKFKRMKGLSVRKLELFDWVSKNREELPKNCFKWNKKTKLEFLAGIFDSDGTLNKKSCFIQLSSKSKKLLMSIQSLLKTMAISSFIDNNENSFRITLSSYDSFNLLKELPVQRLTFEGSAPNRKTTGWRKISRIEKLPGIHKVYCPKVESTGKFALANGLMTGNSEITLYTDPQHTFVCCLSSLNLVRWDEWKDSDLPELATRFLDSVLSEYIEKTKDIEGMEASRNSAIKGRAIGIGVLGFQKSTNALFF